MSITAKDYASGLRELADWIEKNPDIPLPETVLSVYACDGKDQALAIAKAARPFTKEYDNSFFRIKKTFGPLTLRYFFNREDVCVKKVVGKVQVSERYIPGRLVPAHEEEKVEWECHEALLKEEFDEATPA